MDGWMDGWIYGLIHYILFIFIENVTSISYSCKLYELMLRDHTLMIEVGVARDADTAPIYVDG